MFNPLATRATALLTILFVKALDNLSTIYVIRIAEAVPEAGEINLLYRVFSMNYEVASLETVLIATMFVSAAVVYTTYNRAPVIVELLIIAVSLATVNNMLHSVLSFHLALATDIIALGVFLVLLKNIKPDYQPILMHQ